jgi:hypothetical protein
MKTTIVVAAWMLMATMTATAQMLFVHPGALNEKKELDCVKSLIGAGAEPYLSAFHQIMPLAVGGAHALLYVNSSSDEDANISKFDARKAYANALVWYFTDEDIYAQQAITVLNAWSVLQGFNAGSDQDKLQAGWIGALLAPAAEIMRGYSGWKPVDRGNLQTMFKRAFYPALNTPSSWNGNVDLTQIEAMMSIAVFNEDQNEFNMAVERFNKRVPAYFYQISDGGITSISGDGNNIPHFWSNPTVWVDGLTQETCRDNNHHAQYALAAALHAAEVAWHQGVDLYSSHTKRFTDAMELMAKQINSGDMQGICNNNSATTDVFDTWEIGYNHYHFRKGIQLPNTEQILLEKVRNYGASDWNIFFETLTHANVDQH